MTVDPKNISQAVRVLKQVVEKKDQQQMTKKRLLEDPENEVIHLHISLMKIPKLQHMQYHKIKLPHPFMLDTKDVCLFTSDLDRKCPDNERTVAHFSQLLSSVGISVGQIIPFHQLRTEYKTHEARRFLARSYQVFLNDGKISRMMPVALGTFFVRKKKMPISVCLAPDKVKKDFLRAMARTTLTLTGRGSSCGVKVGTMEQSVEDVSENISSVISYLDRDLPGRWANVQSLQVKTKFSMAIPIYISTESPNDVEMPSFQQDDGAVVDDLTTLTSSKVKVFPSGKVRLIKADADDVHNENVDVEKKVLSQQRYFKNQKKRQMEKKFVRMLIRGSRTSSKKSKRNKGTEVTEKPEETEAKSPFGLSRGGQDTRDGLLRKRKKYFDRKESNDNDSADKSFEDSFRVQRRTGSVKESKTIERFERKQIPVQETAEPETSATQGSRLRLHSKKRSYAMLNKFQSNDENVNTELLSFVRKDYVDAMEKEPEKTTRTGSSHKKGKRGKETTRVKDTSKKSFDKSNLKSEKKLSRMQSIRQSVRLAKTLM